MKKWLNTYNGGEATYLDDFRWLQQGNEESFKAVLQAIIPSNELVILSGCTSSIGAGSLINISEGFVSKNGVVYRVLSHSYDSSLVGTPVWQMETLTDPSGVTNYQNGLTHDVYVEDTYKVVLGTVSGTNPQYSTTRNYITVLASILPLAPWVNLITQVIPLSGIIPGTYLTDYKKDLSGFVHIRGKYYFEDISGAVNMLMGTLPVGYRPQSTLTYFIGIQTSNITGTIGFAIIQIENDGEIRLRAAQASGTFILNLEQISPFMGV